MDRIAQAYDEKLFAQLATELTQVFQHHLQNVVDCDRTRLNSKSVESLLKAVAVPVAAKSESQDLVKEFSRVCSTFLGDARCLHSTRYIGHQVPPPVLAASLFHALLSFTNQSSAVFEMSPTGVAVERVMVEELGKRLGWPAGEFDGIVTNGGSLANLTALLTARNIKMAKSWEHGSSGSTTKGVLIASVDSHYSVSRSAGILGIGTDQIIKVAIDDRRRMKPSDLRTKLAEQQKLGNQVIAVVASSGSTAIGAFDDLEAIGKICREFDVWLHVDGAHGASMLMSKQHRPLLRGLEYADSIIWDAHKMLFVPALSTYLFYRRAADSYKTFAQDAPYLLDSEDEFKYRMDGALRTVECTKPATSLALWGVWQLFGAELFEDLIDQTLSLTRRFHEMIGDSIDFVAVHEPQCNILCFRYLPDEVRNLPISQISKYQADLRKKLLESERFYITATTLDGVVALRVTIMNPMIVEDDLNLLLQTLRDLGQKILKSGS